MLNLKKKNDSIETTETKSWKGTQAIIYFILFLSQKLN